MGTGVVFNNLESKRYCDASKPKNISNQSIKVLKKIFSKDFLSISILLYLLDTQELDCGDHGLDSQKFKLNSFSKV